MTQANHTRAGRALFLSTLAVSFAVMAADSTDTTTGLPLHAGLSLDQTVDSPMCKSQSKMVLYDTAPGASMNEYVAWYKGQLKGYQFVQQSFMDRPQNSFWSPDGARSVGITGNPKGDGVYMVTYISISPALKPSEIGKFSPSNPSCK
jgi:hypothetical protein